MADLKKGYEIEGDRIEQMKRGTPCNFGTRPGCYQKSKKVRLLHEDALIVQNMGR